MKSDDDKDVLLRKALAVNDVPHDFDPKKIPQTGEEYIHQVMHEAKQCKSCIHVDIDTLKLKNKRATVEEMEGCIRAPPRFLPNVEWQRQQVADFSAFRDHIAKIRETVEDLPPFNGMAAQWAKRCSKVPSVTDLVTLNQRGICKVFEFHLEWLGDLGAEEMFDNITGTWLYGLLACLELPLMPDMCANLRELARTCSQIRANLPTDTNHDQVKPLNLLITLVARYFNNPDLIDNNNEL